MHIQSLKTLIVVSQIKQKMMKTILIRLLLATLIFTTTEANSITTTTTTQPQLNQNFTLNYIQTGASCSYTVIISTSCSSVSYTRDEISISFGDGYGNQVYAPRIDDPSTRTFEACSSDTFQINGPCTYQICYVYLYRSGYDGWKPDTVKIYGYNTKAVSFYYNTWIPGDAWYGFNLCSNTASSTYQLPKWRWFLFLVLGFALSCLL